MALFKFDTTKVVAGRESIFQAVESMRSMDSQAYARFESMSMDRSQLFISDAKFSSYQLMNFILDKFGPSELYLTIYGISELAMRNISHRKHSGDIVDLHIICSDHIRSVKPAEIQIAEKLATRFVFYPCHAKMIVIKSISGKYAAIVSSMNLNRNNKLEAGTVIFDHQTVQKTIDFLNNIIVCKLARNNSRK